MRKGLVHDAASAKIAAEVNDILRTADMALIEHIGRADQGLYGEWWSKGLSYDLGAIRARLARVRDLVSGSP